MTRRIVLATTIAATLLFAPGVANAGGDTTTGDNASGTDLHVKFPAGSPGRKHGGVATISVCDYDSFDAMRNHFDGGKNNKRHDDIDKAFADAIELDGKTADDAFDLRHKDCAKGKGKGKGHHGGSSDSSSSHKQTKVIPNGAPETGDGSTE